MFSVGADPDGLLVIDIADQIDSEAMRDGLTLVFRELDGVENGRLLYRIRALEMPTMGALMVELGHLPRLFQLIQAIARVAVITDQDWVRRAAEIEAALIPGMEIRVFTPDDEAKARDWLHPPITAPGDTP